jgi:hypothetical protein
MIARQNVKIKSTSRIETQHPKDGIAEQTTCEGRWPPGAVQQGVHSLPKKSMPYTTVAQP